MPPLVSIVIPCFNAASYVAEAIRSSLVQTYLHREVIVIDDGSMDGSVEVLQTFGTDIRWETGPNRGGCSARNRGLQLANGELIQFLDADDWLYPNKLERQVAALAATPQATSVCDWEVVEAGRIVQQVASPDSCEDSLIPLLNGPLQTASPLHRTSILKQVGGFREGLPCSQERDLHLRLACHGWSLQRIPEPLYAVRRLAGSVSSSLEKVLDQHLPIALRLQEILQSRNVWTDERARALAAFLTRDARHLGRLGLTDKADRYFRAACELHASGGWDVAYGQLTRLLATVIGPVRFERLLSLWRRRTVTHTST